MPDEFFKQRREWSKWKHLLLKRYLGQFTGITGSKYPIVYYVDGFAGGGRYQNPAEDGSPIIAAKIAADTSFRRKYSVRCINIEPEHYEDLCAATAEFPPPTVTNLKGTFRQNLETVLATVEEYPTLFFLDPMGHVGMEWDVVERLAQRAGNAITDVLLNFYVTSIDRHAGFLNSVRPEAKAFVTQLNELFGTDEWQSIYVANANDREARFEQMADLYMRRLASAYGRSSGSSPVATRFSVRTIDGQLKYYLISASRHVRGGRAMSDAVFHVDFTYGQARVEARNRRSEAKGGFLFGPEEVPTQPYVDIEKMAADIRELAPLNKAINLDSLEELLLQRWFGRAIRRHYLQACVSLVEAGFATVPPREGRRVVMTERDSITLRKR